MCCRGCEKGLKPLAWGITGAGHFLWEVFNLMLEMRSEVQITSFISSAAEEVIRIYGLWDMLHEISDGRRYSEVFTDQSEGASAIHAGRLARGDYSILVVAPATANTVAKIRHGIADTLATNVAAQALKGGTPLLILPTDQSETMETMLPIRAESSLCVGCQPCPAEEACSRGAFSVLGSKGVIDYLRCVGCGLCLEACSYGAVKRGEKIKVKAREVDLENVERLREMHGVTVLRNPEELNKVLKRYLEGEL